MDRTTNGPIWRAIEQALHDEITNGIWTPGAQLPSETDLAKRFGVNRHTVRRAMSALATRGVIRIEHGRGSFVQENIIHYEVSRRTRVEDNLANLRGGYTGRLLNSFEMPCPKDAAAALGIDPGETVVVLDTLNESDDVPISLVRTYFHALRFAEFATHYVAGGNSMTAGFAAYGITDFSRLSTDISARMPTVEEATLLKQPTIQPVLISSTVDVDPEGQRIKFGIARFPAGRVSLTVENSMKVDAAL
ncbi:phosphonate metabolism transcriptional regulator PhnF [Arenibacterium sp. LLYu02]|uniref:phosphonate metabolism transcriptional regulator PhnF n=1 Tax=Arenibacterium sp. LLYu02 TaxID=3404132 RepID=UPI003B21D0A9